MKNILVNSVDILLSVFRILLGLIFLLGGGSKLISDNMGTTSMLSVLEGKQELTFGFYLTFIEQVVMSAPLLFALLVAIGEIALGIALISNKKLKFVGGLGILMLINFMCLKGQYPWQWGADQLFSVIILLVMFTQFGQRWGYDQFRSHRAKTA